MSEHKWEASGSSILTTERLTRLRMIIENESAVVVEHRFYRGGRAPYRFVTDDFENLEHYLREKTMPGDAIYIWRFDECCRDDNIALTGKVPDQTGSTPVGGAF